MQTIDPSASRLFRAVYDLSRETGYANNDPIGTLTDRSVTGLGLNLTAAGGARPTFIANQLNGHGVARFNGSANILAAATAADWTWLHDGHSLSLFVLAKQERANANALEVLLDTCRVSSSNRGLSLYLDDRAASSLNQAYRVFLSNGSGVGANVPITNAGVNNTFNPLIWNLYEFHYGPAGGGLEQLGLAGPDFRLLVNGVVATGGDWDQSHAHAAAAPVDALRVGAHSGGGTPTGFFQGDIAFIGLADSHLSWAYRNAVARYICDTFDVWDTSWVTLENNWNSAPFVVRLPDHTLLATYHRLVTEDVTTRNPTLTVRSGDGGRTWNHPAVAFQESGEQDGPGGLVVTSAGTVLLPIIRYTSATARTLNLLRSTNYALSWSAPIDTHAASGFTDTSSVSGMIPQLSNGRLLMGVNGQNLADSVDWIKCVYSDDDGATWAVLSTMADKRGTSKSLTECSIAKLSGTFPNESLIALYRNDTDSAIESVVSSDSGATWGGTATVKASHLSRPIVWKSAAGNLFTAIRPTTGNSRLVIFHSTNDGATWSSTPYWMDAIDGFTHYAGVIPDIEPGVHYVIFTSYAAGTVPAPSIPRMEKIRARRVKEAELLLFT